MVWWWKADNFTLARLEKGVDCAPPRDYGISWLACKARFMQESRMARVQYRFSVV